MSNRLCLQPTKFIDIDQDGIEHDVAYGFRAYDDYGSTYNNTLSPEEFKDALENMSPREIMTEYMTESEQDQEMYNAAVEKGGMLYCDSWIDFKNEDES